MVINVIVEHLLILTPWPIYDGKCYYQNLIPSIFTACADKGASTSFLWLSKLICPLE